MTASRRTLGTGPTARIQASQADLEVLPSVNLPDVAELRARGVLGGQKPTGSTARRVLGSGRIGDTP
ncbi:hypothetical protein GTY65_34225 [Streptomyces sp. SID8379]|uniref:hypothetical protein n=1 Tax=unclassified Streptomyces TaxID=2593676 RepID=UPI00131A3C0E|nr:MULTISPECIES: hypothetical protein [unclassified Streptomyces]MYW69093.1 hypothetical protein [Streptomyces sp. SID8379]